MRDVLASWTSGFRDCGRLYAELWGFAVLDCCCEFSFPRDGGHGSLVGVAATSSQY